MLLELQFITEEEMNKRGQEEIVGFALIIIIVAVALLFLFSFYIRGNDEESAESYEVDSFVQSVLYYTTDCENFLGNFSVQELISECKSEERCSDERDSCEILNQTLREISGSSWQFGSDRPVSGYVFNVSVGGLELVSVQEGVQEGNFRNALQSVNSRGDSIEVSFRVYFK